MFGLSDDDLDYIINTISKYVQVERAIIFGSRATDDYQKGSDIDIALIGNVEEIILEISYQLNEESLIPYQFDILDYQKISNVSLLTQIDKYGKIIYTRN